MMVLKTLVVRICKLLLLGMLSGTIVNWTMLTHLVTKDIIRCLPEQHTTNMIYNHKITQGVPNSTNKLHLVSEMPDTRFEMPYGPLPPQCIEKSYNLSHLPEISVVITYHDNEHVVQVLRTIESIMKRTPHQLLKEIVLVNDHASKDELTTVMEQYIRSIYDPTKIRLIRNTGERGLIQARHSGIMHALGEVVVCMDSHMEVQHKWLEPLLDVIHENPSTLASSYLDWMKYSDAEGKWIYTIGGSTWKTVFDWKLTFGFQDISPEDLKQRFDLTEPIESPVMVGTLWAMRKDMYVSVGGMDTALQGWGAENIDLALNMWLSGGRVVNVPCSHAAHLEDSRSRLYRANTEWKRKISQNNQRVAEKWFGKYTRYYHFYSNDDNANMTNMQQAIQHRNHPVLHDFDWYLENIFPELGRYDIDVFAYGLLRNRKYNTCVHVSLPSVPTLFPCSDKRAAHQVLSWTTDGEIRLPMHSLNIQQSNKKPIKFDMKADEYMSSKNASTKWFHTEDGLVGTVFDESHRLMSPKEFNYKCLSAEDKYTLSLDHCNISQSSQKWTFSTYTTEYKHIISRTNRTKIYEDIHYLSQLFHKDAENLK